MTFVIAGFFVVSVFVVMGTYCNIQSSRIVHYYQYGTILYTISTLQQVWFTDLIFVFFKFFFLLEIF